MMMPKQFDVKVTKPQNKHGQGRTRKYPIGFLITYRDMQQIHVQTVVELVPVLRVIVLEMSINT